MVEPLDDGVRLIERIVERDQEAFARFYDRYASLVFTFAVRLLRARPDAEDLLQEVFLQVWRQAATYGRERGSPEAWLLTITRSRGIDKLRSIRRRKDGVVAGELSATHEVRGRVESGASQAEARVTLGGALAGLPDTQRAVLELAYFDGLTQTEIAARLGEPLGTVKTRTRAGLERLRGLVGTRAASGGA